MVQMEVVEAGRAVVAAVAAAEVAAVAAVVVVAEEKRGGFMCILAGFIIWGRTR